MHCLLATYYTSPESWGPCLSFCDDNDNDKDTHKDKDKDKDKENDKDKVPKRPITCYIFEKLGVQGYQIWHSCIISASQDQTTPHQTRSDQIRSDQIRLEQRRLPSRGPYSRTCVLVHFGFCLKIPLFRDACFLKIGWIFGESLRLARRTSRSSSIFEGTSFPYHHKQPIPLFQMLTCRLLQILLLLTLAVGAPQRRRQRTRGQAS